MLKWLSADQSDQNRPYFNKRMTNINKGIALILMFIGHFFTESSWWVEGISYPTLEKLVPKYHLLLMDCVYIF